MLSADCRLTWRMASLLRSPTRVMPLQKSASTDLISHEKRISGYSDDIAAAFKLEDGGGGSVRGCEADGKKAAAASATNMR